VQAPRARVSIKSLIETFLKSTDVGCSTGRPINSVSILSEGTEELKVGEKKTNKLSLNSQARRMEKAEL